MNDYFDQNIHSSDADSANSDSAEDTPSESTPLTDTGEANDQTAPSIKAAVQELLKYGLIEQSTKPNLYRTLVAECLKVKAILEPFDFDTQVDDVRGLVFLRVADVVASDADEAWSHPLMRRHRLTLEQTLLIAILRQFFVAYEQDCGIGAEGARVDFDELRIQFDLYLGETGSDQKNSNRLSNVLEQLQKHGIVSAPDKENYIQIRPIIVHLANPEQLGVLLSHFKATAEAHPASGYSKPESEDETLPDNDES